MSKDSKEAMRLHSVMMEDSAKLLFADASNALPDWKEAFWDMRIDPDQPTVAMSVAMARDSKQCVSIESSSEHGQVLGDLKHERNQGRFPGDPWVGIRLHLSRAGEVTVHYDYDEDCIETMPVRTDDPWPEWP